MDLRLWNVFFLIIFPVCVNADELPLSEFPLFTQATAWVNNCVSSLSSRLSVSFGCDPVSPAPCLCTDAKKSLQVARGIRCCILSGGLEVIQTTTATELWASYCLTNAGVSARDETLLENIPLFTQATGWIGACAASETAQYITSYGCDDYTKAPCLCGNSASSLALQEAIKACISSGGVPQEEQATGAVLFRSFCDVNLKQAATRTIGKPISVSATLTGSNSAATQTDPLFGASPSFVTGPRATGTTSTPREATTSTETSSGSSTNWEAIGAILGVCGVLVAVGIAWWTDRRNRWLRNFVMNVRHHHPPTMVYPQQPGHMWQNQPQGHGWHDQYPSHVSNVQMNRVYNR